MPLPSAIVLAVIAALALPRPLVMAPTKVTSIALMIGNVTSARRDLDTVIAMHARKRKQTKQYSW